ncbi:MAG: carboxypeptidase-like regulatory domain-containing protein, partial [Bacteroidota bacterium]
MKRILLLCFALFTFISYEVMAQRTVSGKITDETGEALPGVNVLIKGTTTGTQTDLDGNFQVSVDDGATLVFSYVGFETQEIEVGARTTIDITMGGAIELQEVVVTSYGGIEKEAKSLGYSVGTVSNEDLVGKARDANVVNSLAGKVAGVNIISASGIPGGGSRIEIRGQASLNTADENQPLFVVDGVPIFNSNPRVSGNGTTGVIQGTVDTGNAAADINPDDIESVNILRGGAAAALYGSRAKDGVVIITTKRAKKGKASITINSSTRFDTPFRLPDYQNEYAPGDFGKYLLDSRERPLEQLNGWGPRIEGQIQPDFRGEMISLTSQKDNVEDFYETGLTLINSASFSNGGEFGDVRVSIANTRQTGILPNSELVRYNVGLSMGTRLMENLETRINVNYVDTETNGIPIQGGNDVNAIGGIIPLLGRTVDVDVLEEFIDPETGQQIPLTESSNNPYFIVNRNTNSQKRERIFGSFELTYGILDNLSITARQGLDYFNNVVQRKVYSGTLGLTTN